MNKTMKNLGIGCGLGTVVLIFLVIAISLLAAMCSTPTEPVAEPAEEITVATSAPEEAASTPTDAPPAPTYTPESKSGIDAVKANAYINEVQKYANQFVFLFGEIATESNKAASDPYTYFLNEEWIINYGALGYALVDTSENCLNISNPPDIFAPSHTHLQNACRHAKKAGQSIVDSALYIAEGYYDRAATAMRLGTESMMVVNEEIELATMELETIADQLP